MNGYAVFNNEKTHKYFKKGGGNENKYLEVEIDTLGGSNYINMGSTQMMSVPYALFARTAGTSGTVGVTGATGSNGTNGTNGTNGNQGTTGSTGATGTNGPTHPRPDTKDRSIHSASPRYLTATS